MSETGLRFLRLDEDLGLDLYVKHAQEETYTTTLYETPSDETMDGMIGIADNKGYFK